MKVRRLDWNQDSVECENFLKFDDITHSHFFLQSVRAFEHSRLADYDADSFEEFHQLVQPDPGFNLRNCLPIKQELRPKFRALDANFIMDVHQAAGYLEVSVRYADQFEQNLIEDNWWPPYVLHQRFHLERSGFRLQSAEETSREE